MARPREFQSLDDFMTERLQDSNNVIGYLEAALEEYEQDQDLNAFIIALRRVVEVKGGVGWLSAQTGLNRQNLYKIFSFKVCPRFDTLTQILKALGFTLSLKTIEAA